jgi:SAM-dependent methyltransferase
MEKSEYLRMYTLESDFWWYKVLHDLVELTIRKNKKTGAISMFDAGCGTGRMMEILQKYGSLSGIDYSADAIGFAEKRGLKNIELGDLNKYNFQNDSYDVIVCLDVLYHAGIQNDLAVVEKLRQALKEGGILVLNLPAFDYLKRPHDAVVHTKRRYRKNIFVEDLKKIGFSEIRSSYRMPHLYFIILISKLLRGKSNTKESESDLKELPGWLNTLLYKFGRIENWWLKHGFGFPVGSSLFVVAKK